MPVVSSFSTTKTTSVPAVVIALLIGMAASPAHAQPAARREYNAGRSGSSGGGDLPFSQQYRRPSISPYNQLNTYGSNPLLSQNVYQQQIQPQMQQQQQQLEQISQRRQMTKLQNQVQQIGRDTSGRQIDESIRPTGHRATYMNYSHYYQ